jgi:hypothetical protein
MGELDAVEREARILGEYLLGVRPTSKVTAAYADLQTRAQIGDPVDRFDLLLLRWALLGSLPARGADLYARILRPNAWLRRKLILLLALVEVHGSDARILGRPGSSGPVVFFTGAVLRGTLSVMMLALSFPILGLSHLALGRREGAR